MTQAAHLEQTFTDKRQAFLGGVKQALGAPMLVLFAGMVGFGAMAHTNGVNAWIAGLSSLLMFALPGQVVMLEMMISASSFLAISLAVTLTSARFITMTITLFPQLAKEDRNAKLYAYVHLLAMTAWAMSMREFPKIEPKYRLNYFLGLGLPCWLVVAPATILGYVLAGSVPTYITLALVFINPLFFLLTFTEVKPWGNRLAIVFGCVLGPLFFLLDKDSSLLATGLVAGTLAYWADLRFLRGKKVAA